MNPRRSLGLRDKNIPASRRLDFDRRTIGDDFGHAGSELSSVVSHGRMAFAPTRTAWLIINSYASLREASASFVNRSMVPSKTVCSDAPMLPKIERLRTVIPLTTPKFATTLQPSKLLAVVTQE